MFKVTEATNWEVTALANSEVRIIILYCTQSEAALILEQAAKSGQITFYGPIPASFCLFLFFSNTNFKLEPVGISGVEDDTLTT